MKTEKTNGLQQNNSNPEPSRAHALAGARFCLKECSADDLKTTLMNSYNEASPWEELVLTAEAVFEFVWNSELELSIRNAVYQLEKQFQFYRRLMELKG